LAIHLAPGFASLSQRRPTNAFRTGFAAPADMFVPVSEAYLRRKLSERRLFIAVIFPERKSVAFLLWKIRKVNFGYRQLNILMMSHY